MDVLLFSGQSNMQGQTECLPQDNEQVARAWEYRSLTNTLVPLRHPVGEDIGNGMLLAAHEGHGSLLPAFCRAYVQESNRSVLAVHAAKGATVAKDWLPPSERYEALARKCAGGIAKAGSAGVRGKIWFIWLQGESDAIAAIGEQEYMNQLIALRQALQKRLSIDGFLIIRVGRFAGDARDFAIMRAQERLCREGEGFVLLTRRASALSKESEYTNPNAAGHYNNAGMELIGEAAGTNAAKLALGLQFHPGAESFEEVLHG